MQQRDEKRRNTAVTEVAVAVETVAAGADVEMQRQ